MKKKEIKQEWKERAQKMRAPCRYLASNGFTSVDRRRELGRLVVEIVLVL